MKRNIVSLIILFILVMSIDSCAENVSNIENQDTYGAKASKEDSDLELKEMLMRLTEIKDDLKEFGVI